MTYTEYLPEGTADLQKKFNKELNSKNAQNLQEQMGKCSFEGSKQQTNQPQKRPGAAGWRRRQENSLVKNFREKVKVREQVKKKENKLEKKAKILEKVLKEVIKNLSKFKFK